MFSEFKNTNVDPREISTNSLAFLGDSVFTMFIREHLLVNSKEQAGKLHRRAIKYESAKSQSKIMKHFTDEDFLTESEIEIFKRGRNSNACTVPRNVDVTIYKIATGFESMLGYIYMQKDLLRLEEIMKEAIRYIDEGIAKGEI